MHLGSEDGVEDWCSVGTRLSATFGAVTWYDLEEKITDGPQVMELSELVAARGANGSAPYYDSG